MRRVFVIGLDGGTFDLIAPLITEGKLPNIQKLINNGTSAPLESTPFPHSVPAWSSCITGVNPGKHGVFGFGVREDNNSYRFKLPNSTSLKAKTLASLLTEHGKYTGLINYILSYPPYNINGFMISGMLTPGSAGSFTFPPELQQELMTLVPDYATEVSPFEFDRTQPQGKAAYATALFTSIRARAKAARILMERKKWDLFMVVFTELDRIQHNFWAEMDVSHFLHQKAEKSLSKIISKAYEELDVSIGMLLEGLPEDTQVFIISDHGFGPIEKIFFMNRFLKETGFLKLKGQRYFTILNMMRGFTKRFNYLRRQSKRLEVVRESDPRNYSGKVEQWVSEELLDWNRTRAFADQYGIRMNMRGREPNGIVSTGKEATHIFRELTDELLKLRFPHNGKPVFSHIESCQDVYIGPFVEKAPDLVTFMDVGSPHYSLHAEALFGESRITTGSHRKDGIFIGWGQGIKQGQRLQKAMIVDVTPTVLYSLGAPLTPEMDGRVLDIFEKGLDLAKISDRRGTSFLKEEERPAYTPEQEEEIENRLKGLGYLG